MSHNALEGQGLRRRRVQGQHTLRSDRGTGGKRVQRGTREQVGWIDVFEQHATRTRRAAAALAHHVAEKLGLKTDETLQRMLERPRRLKQKDDQEVLERFLGALLSNGQMLMDSLDFGAEAPPLAEQCAADADLLASMQSLERACEEIAGLPELLGRETRELFSNPQVDSSELHAVKEMLRYLPARFKLGKRVKPADAVCLRTKEDAEAVDHLVSQRDALRAITRDDAGLLWTLGRLLIAWGDARRAAECFEVAAQGMFHARQRARYLLDAFHAALQAGEHARALSNYGDAVKGYPSGCSLFDGERYSLRGLVSGSAHAVRFLAEDSKGRRCLVQSVFEEERELKKIFKRVRRLKGLSSPYLARLYEWGWANRRKRSGPYLVWEFIDGVSLREKVERDGRFRQPEAVLLLRALASGLRAAFRKGVLHRNLMPDKVRFDAGGNPRLLGFGLSRAELRVKLRFAEFPRPPEFLAARVEEDRLYLAPEQRGTIAARAGPHSDVYGLGRLACFVLFGSPRPEPQRLKVLQPEFGRVLQRCLVRDPQQRFASVKDLIPALDTLVQTPGLRPQDALKKSLAAPIVTQSSKHGTGRLLGFFGRLFRKPEGDESRGDALWWKPHEEQRREERMSARPLVSRNGLDMAFCLIPSGSVELGSPESETGRRANEAIHTVRLSYPYYMKATPVTQGEWYRVMGTRPFFFQDAGEDVPAENLSWFDAVAFCNQLSERESLNPSYELEIKSRSGSSIQAAEVRFKGLDSTGYRLPTEAEWERACRAETRTPWWSGRPPARGFEEQAPLLVKKQPCNPFGLFAMHGNVWEWCGDWYGYDYDGRVLSNPLGPESGDRRVKRGGSFSGAPGSGRAAFRGRQNPASRHNDLGLRPVRTVISAQTRRMRIPGLKG